MELAILNKYILRVFVCQFIRKMTFVLVDYSVFYIFFILENKSDLQKAQRY